MASTATEMDYVDRLGTLSPEDLREQNVAEMAMRQLGRHTDDIHRQIQRRRKVVRSTHFMRCNHGSTGSINLRQLLKLSGKL